MLCVQSAVEGRLKPSGMKFACCSLAAELFFFSCVSTIETALKKSVGMGKLTSVNK